MENTASFRYGYLLHLIHEMKRIAEEDRSNTTEGRHRKIKKMLLDVGLCKILEEDYPAFYNGSTQSEKVEENK